MGGARHRGMVQDRLPAFWNGDALVSVDQFEISEADVQSLLDEQCGVILCLVQHAGLLPQYWMLLSPGVLCYGQLFCLSLSGGSSVLLYAGLKGSLGLSYIYIATTARYLVHDPRLLLQWSWSLTFVSCPWRVDADRNTVRMLYLLHTRLTSSLRPAT